MVRSLQIRCDVACRSDITGSDNLSSLTALLEALSNLDELCVTVDEAYNRSLSVDPYEHWDEKS